MLNTPLSLLSAVLQTSPGVHGSIHTHSPVHSCEEAVSMHTNMEKGLAGASRICGHQILNCAFENGWIDKYGQKASSVLAWWSITMPVDELRELESVVQVQQST